MTRTAVARANAAWTAVASPRSRRVRSALFDLAVCAGFGLVATATLPDTMDDLSRGAALVFGFAMAMALLFRRRWPLAVMCTVVVLALARRPPSPMAVPLPSDIAVLIAMYSVVKYARRMRDGWLAAGLVAIAVAVQLVRDYAAWHAIVTNPKLGGVGIDDQELTQVEPWWRLILLYGSICVGVWLAGFAVRTRRRYLASLEERAATAERERDALALVAMADERTAIARELHDVVAHTLAVMVMQADGATYTIDSDPTRARAATQTVASIGREAMDDMRRLVALLRGTRSAADDEDRRPLTLDQLVQRARSAGLAVEMHLRGNPGRLPAAVELTVHRLVQEALTNVLRHGGQGSAVTIILEHSTDAAELEVTDDGAGPAQASAASHQSPPDRHGLLGMRERVAVHGGELSAGPRPGGGWRVRARLPLPTYASPGQPP